MRVLAGIDFKLRSATDLPAVVTTTNISSSAKASIVGISKLLASVATVPWVTNITGRSLSRSDHHDGGVKSDGAGGIDVPVK